VQFGDRARPDARADEHALRTIASAAAAELARNAAMERSRERALRAEAVLEAAVEIAALRDPDRIAQALAARATLLCGATAVFVRVLDPARGRHRLAGPRDALEWQESARVALDRRAAGEALRRRAPIDVDPAEGDGASAVLALPILAGERALGILSLHADAPQRFDATARATAARLATFAAIALDAALAAPAATRADALLSAAALDERIDAEIARAAESGGEAGFTLLTCRIENAEALGAAATDRALRAAARALVEQLRPFDAVAATDGAALLALLPAPGTAPSERVARLARAVAEAVAKERDPGSAALVFGHATHPGDAPGGARKGALLARAAEPRIRIL
jgi:GGDEF domain-containing protein